MKNLEDLYCTIKSKIEQSNDFDKNEKTFSIPSLIVNRKPHLSDIFDDIENVIKTTLEDA